VTDTKTVRTSPPGTPAAAPRKGVRGPLPWIVMAALFVAAVVYIRTAVPGEGTPAPAPSAHGSHAAGFHGDGLSDAQDGYRLEPVTLPDTRGAAVPLAFRILGPDGAPVTGYATVLDEPLHLYVVREDLSVYQHLHPTLADGTWSTTVSVPDGGVYRMYADFTPLNRNPTVLGVPFVIAGDTRYVPLALPAASATAGGFTVRRVDGLARLPAKAPGTLRFQVLDAAGAPVTALERYLGVYAHVSAFDIYDQALTHLHPADSAAPPADGILTFHTGFRQRGEQRLFLQFKAGGTVHEVAFTVTVG